MIKHGIIIRNNIGKLSLLFLVLVPFASFSQKPLKIKYTPAGIFSLGIRTPFLITNSANEINLFQGLGCQARLQLGRHYNTEWFAEYMSGRFGDSIIRHDLHFGAEFMLYPQLRKHRVEPFVLAGPLGVHSGFHEQVNSANKASIWNFGLQGGLGMHINVTWRTDITLSAQYLFNFGRKIQALNTGDQIIFSTYQSAGDGHVMLNMSFNFKMFDLWKRIRL